MDNRGDFNMIRSLDEKKGGVRTISAATNLFNEFIEESNLVDIRTTNGMVIWQNKRIGDRHIVSRLDRFLVSEHVLTGRGDVGASVLTSAGSDHWPICLEWGNTGIFIKRPFRFENFWFQHKDIWELMKEWWQSCPLIEGSPMYTFQQKLKYIKERIKKWNKDSFSNIMEEKEKLEKRIEEIKTQAIREGYTKDKKGEEQALIHELMRREQQEEILWK